MSEFRLARTMGHLFSRAVLIPGLLAAAGCSEAQPPAGPANGSVSPAMAFYQNYCAACHGRQMEGGNGGPLRAPSDFQHGYEPEAIFNNIRNGIRDLGMPAYGSTLTDDQIRDLVALIRNQNQGTTSATAQSGGAPNASSQAPVSSGREHSRVRTLDYEVRVEVWVDGLNTPWAIDFPDSRTALVTEKGGPLRIIRDGKLLPEPVKGTPRVWSRGQGGMMDVAVDPDYARNGWIYLSFSDPAAGGAMTRIVRGRIRDGVWTDQENIWQAGREHYSSSGIHFGSRIVFGPDGKLYFSVGERGSQERAQDLSKPNGKIYRLNRDGSAPEDNPFAGREGVFLPQIFSWGHRNPQGLAFHPLTGELWAVEHGPRGGDELNLIRPGQNYGWPLITYGINYNGQIITRERVRPGLMQPIYFWRPSIAVAGCEFYTGNLFPYWRNHLLVTSLADKDLRLLHIQENRVLHEEILMDNVARIREAVTGPDGAIYLVTNDPGQILRLTPIAEQPR